MKLSADDARLASASPLGFVSCCFLLGWATVLMSVSILFDFPAARTERSRTSTSCQRVRTNWGRVLTHVHMCTCCCRVSSMSRCVFASLCLPHAPERVHTSIQGPCAFADMYRVCSHGVSSCNAGSNYQSTSHIRNGVQQLVATRSASATVLSRPSHCSGNQLHPQHTEVTQ